MKLYTKKLFLALFLGLISMGINAQSVWTNGGGTNVWSDFNNWSTLAVPGAADNVVFDGTSTANCTIDMQADCNDLSINAGYTGTIDGNGNAIIVANDFLQAAGTLDASSGAFQVTNNSTLSGGTFDVNSSNTDFTGNFTMTGGIFNSSTGIITFAGTFDQSAGTFNGNTANLSITGAMTISGTATFNGGSSGIFIANNFDLQGGTFNSTSSTFTTQGNSWSTSGGSFNANGGTILVERTSTTTFVVTGGFTFNVLTLSASGGISTKVINFNSSSTAATVNLSGGAHGFRYLGNLAVTSQLNINGTNTGTPAPNTGIFTFTGAGPFTIAGASAAARNKIGGIVMNNTGNVSLSGHISLVGSWNSTAGLGSFTSGSSTLNFYGASGNINAGTTATTRAYLDNLTINTGATLNVTTGSYVDLSGNFTKTGTGVFTSNTSLFLFTGAGGHTIGGTGTLTAFNAIEKSGAGGLTIGSVTHMITIADSLRITGGAVSTTNLRLKSTSALKARIAEISGGGSLGGTISVETFIPGGLTDWAVLGGSGVSGLTFNNWYGTIPMAIEGSTTGVTSAGGQYFESVWRFDETDAFGYDSTVTVTDPINTGQGYWLFVGTGLASTSAITTTVSGAPITGSQPITLSNSAQGGFCLVANPYASPISWDRIITHNAGDFVSDATYIYNADLGLTTSYISGVSSNSPGANSTIPMGQGFYVEADAAGDLSLDILESDKVSNNTVLDQLLKSGNPNTTASIGNVIYLKLDGGGYTDQTAIRFHSAATPSFDRTLDAKKLFDSPGYAGYGKNPWTLRTTISTQGGNTDYSINSLPYALVSAAVIPVLAKVYATGQHTISGVNLNNLAPGTCVVLKDKLLNVTQDLKLGNYVCTLSDTATTARFELTICPNITAGVNNTPIASENVFVKQDNNGVYVDLSFEKNTKAVISANNILGQQLMTPKQVECVSGKYYLDLNAKEQIIMVNVIANDKRTTKKIFIQNQN